MSNLPMLALSIVLASAAESSPGPLYGHVSEGPPAVPQQQAIVAASASGIALHPPLEPSARPDLAPNMINISLLTGSTG